MRHSGVLSSEVFQRGAMADQSERPITRQELFEILEDFVTRPELRVIEDAQEMATKNGKRILAITKALLDSGILTEQQLEQNVKPAT